MKKKTVVIGGSSGMGLAIAKAAYYLEHDVVIASRSKEKLKKAQQHIGAVQIHPLDITQEKKVMAFFSSIGPFDHLVITAADFIMGPFLTLKTDEAKRFFASKFWGQYCAAKHGAPHIRPDGSITFFCGVAGQKPMKNFAAGAAINAALEGLTRALALELAPIRVNAIAPGAVVTPVWDSLPKKKRLAQLASIKNKSPLHRIGVPDDIVQAVLYLMHCAYATGSIVYVDGGDRLI
jgi:NAD(P)-dependent dehydrogenase (short-subunit alcohol dehydrogenase family)